MRSRDALRVLAEVSKSQWGMVTSAQASARGVSHMNLTRLAESGDLVRLSHGVYKDAGAPGGEHDELRAAWLASDPTRLAWSRLREKPGKVVVSGESASRLHGIGELRAMRSEFTTPTRKQTQRPEIRYRTRVLTSDDVTIREGLPVTTRERTIADLVEDRQDLSLVGHVLHDAARQSQLDVGRLIELLSPLAERNGHPKGAGDALLNELMTIAGIDAVALAKQLASIESLGALITENYLRTLSQIDIAPLRGVLRSLAEQLAVAVPTNLSERQFSALTETLAAIASSGVLNAQAFAEQLRAVALALPAQAAIKAVDEG